MSSTMLMVSTECHPSLVSGWLDLFIMLTHCYVSVIKHQTVSKGLTGQCLGKKEYLPRMCRSKDRLSPLKSLKFLKKVGFVQLGFCPPKFDHEGF